MKAHRESVARRLEHMAATIRARKGRVEWRELVATLVSPLKRGDQYGELRAIFNHVKKAIRYTKDPAGLDAYYDPEIALEQGIGDCDEQTTAVGLLAQTIGYPVKLRAVSFDGMYFSHVYALAGLKDPAGWKWISMDTVYANTPGYAPDDKGRIEVTV